MAKAIVSEAIELLIGLVVIVLFFWFVFLLGAAFRAYPFIFFSLTIPLILLSYSFRFPWFKSHFDAHLTTIRRTAIGVAIALGIMFFLDGTRFVEGYTVTYVAGYWLFCIAVPGTVYFLTGERRPVLLGGMMDDPLLLAIGVGDCKKVRELLDERPRLARATDKHGWSALNEAISRGHLEIAELLVARGANVHAKYGNRSLLHDAVGIRTGVPHRSVAEFLLLNGVRPNVKDEDEFGHTPLHVICKCRICESDPEVKRVAELLLANRANPDARDNDQRTPLHLLLHERSQGGADLLELLIRYKAQVNLKDKWDMTPLHVTAAGGHTRAADMLLANGAYIEAKSAGFMTPLHYAACNGHREVVDLLLQHGADVAAKDHFGRTALQLASNNHCNVVEALLRKHGAE